MLLVHFSVGDRLQDDGVDGGDVGDVILFLLLLLLLVDVLDDECAQEIYHCHHRTRREGGGKTMCARSWHNRYLIFTVSTRLGGLTALHVQCGVGRELREFTLQQKISPNLC